MAQIKNITDLKIPELDIYARMPEVQLLRYYEPQQAFLLQKARKSSRER